MPGTSLAFDRNMRATYLASLNAALPSELPLLLLLPRCCCAVPWHLL